MIRYYDPQRDRRDTKEDEGLHMGITAAVCALLLVAEAPFGQPDTEGLFKEPIRRYVEVQFDFLTPPPVMPLSVPVDAPPPAPPAELPAPVEAVPGLPPPPQAPPAPMQIALGPAQVGGRSCSSLSLHPEGVQQATASFPAVPIRPVVGEWPRAFLVFRTGLADPLVEGDAAPLSPLTLTVSFGDSIIHSEEVSKRQWSFRAIDVTPFAGQINNFTFVASTLNPDEKRSVLCLGDPMLIEEQGIYYLRPGGRSLSFGFSLGGFPRNTPGLALAQVQSEAGATVDLSLGDGSEQHNVPAGTHWLPLMFTKPGRFSFKATSGDAKFLRLDVAPFTPTPHFQAKQ